MERQQDLGDWSKEYKTIKTKIKKIGINIFKRLRFLKTTTLKNTVFKMMKKETER